jgi:hypothetical protein
MILTEWGAEKECTIPHHFTVALPAGLATPAASLLR